MTAQEFRTKLQEAFTTYRGKLGLDVRVDEDDGILMDHGTVINMCSVALILRGEARDCSGLWLVIAKTLWECGSTVLTRAESNGRHQEFYVGQNHLTIGVPQEVAGNNQCYVFLDGCDHGKVLPHDLLLVSSGGSKRTPLRPVTADDFATLDS